MAKTNSFHTIIKKLKEQRSILITRLERKRESIQTDDVLNPDADDRAKASRKNDRDKLLLDRTEQQIRDIDEALIRSDAGNFGVCENCGENIQLARLEIMPTAALCITCQQIEDNELIG
jgi:DnaK suppressor protein